MCDTPFSCATCGTQNPGNALFCHACGTRLGVAPDSEHPAKTVTREVVTRTGETLRDKAIKQATDFLVGKLFALWTTIAALAQSAVLTLFGGRSFLEWFLLTWPLTIAAALIALANQQSLKGSLAIVPVGAAILVIPGYVGTAIAGATTSTAPAPSLAPPSTSWD
jgi:hypothetical protein